MMRGGIFMIFESALDFFMNGVEEFFAFSRWSFRLSLSAGFVPVHLWLQRRCLF